MKKHLLSGEFARHLSISDNNEQVWLHNLDLLMDKPVIYICNVHKNDMLADNIYVKQVVKIAAKEGARILVISAEKRI